MVLQRSWYFPTTLEAFFTRLYACGEPHSKSVFVDGYLLHQVPALDRHGLIGYQVLYHHVSHVLAVRIPVRSAIQQGGEIVYEIS